MEFKFTLDESVIKNPADVTTDASKEHRKLIAEELNNKTSKVAFWSALFVFYTALLCKYFINFSFKLSN